MSVQSTATRLLLASLGPIATWDTPFAFYRVFTSSKPYIFVVYILLYTTTVSWASLVTRIVPEPYLVRAVKLVESQDLTLVGRGISYPTSSGIL